MPYGQHVLASNPKPDRKPRDKRVRVTVDLTPAEFEALNRWLAKASVELDQPISDMTFARGIKAMIQATATDDAVSGVVLDVLRTDQA
jgi:hypothetical protein